MSLSQNRWLRRIALPLLRALCPQEIRIRHHYTGDRLTLNTFMHKGYWFHGKQRERATMELFARLIRPGFRVCEVGGHVGYISLYFRHLAKPGSITVFEPGANNLSYIRRNLQGTGIHLIEKAVGNTEGKVQFFLDSLTGQNNSLVQDFKGLEQNSQAAFVPVTVTTVEVDCVTLDSQFPASGPGLDFIKIDVEGAELGVLEGATGLLARCRPALMVEVQASQQPILDLLESAGYRLFTPALVPCRQAADLSDNIFALHREAHAPLLKELGIAP